MILYQTVLWFDGLRCRVSTLIFCLSGLNFMKSQTIPTMHHSLAFSQGGPTDLATFKVNCQIANLAR